MMKRVLFVCLGNICRSPTGEAVLKRMIQENNLSHLLACESAGTAGYHIGERPDHRTRAHGEKRGYRFDSLAQQFDPKKDFEAFDLIVCMDRSNLQNVLRLDLTGKYRDKVKLLMEFAIDASNLEVPDPYYEGAEAFETVIDLCENACRGLIHSLAR
ncbi:MAG: low molecular weight phosphotyrosine protein phosphatase [Bdellovibrionaceae bacterium]|nr:low molecular weight phosphotyrosine protein phosphatase [Pseudobdellovibrionaceae bacterium]